MQSKFFTLKWKDIFGAVILAAIVALIQYVLKVGDVFALDYHSLINNAVIAGSSALLMALFTTQNGDFAGAIPVK